MPRSGVPDRRGRETPRRRTARERPGNGPAIFFRRPGLEGSNPRGFKKVFRCETEIVGILERSQLNGPDDVENVRKVQAGFRITPLAPSKTGPRLTSPLPDQHM